MELKLIDKQGSLAGHITAPDSLFAREYNESLVHQLVTAYLANARQGTRAQKTRAEVRHSTKKPWRQKGTGRARAGSVASPLWRKGGRAFPSKPWESFSQKINKKMYRAGMATILSQLARDERLFVIEELSASSPKTGDFVREMTAIGLEKTLFLTNEITENVYLSSRNLATTLVLETQKINPYSLLYYHRVILTKDAVSRLEEQLS